jgi:hypothetical protein
MRAAGGSCRARVPEQEQHAAVRGLRRGSPCLFDQPAEHLAWPGMHRLDIERIVVEHRRGQRDRRERAPAGQEHLAAQVARRRTRLRSLGERLAKLLDLAEPGDPPRIRVGDAADREHGLHEPCGHPLVALDRGGLAELRRTLTQIAV